MRQAGQRRRRRGAAPAGRSLGLQGLPGAARYSVVQLLKHWEGMYIGADRRMMKALIKEPSCHRAASFHLRSSSPR
ncbi:hypothetical protein MASSI9I_100175 [Massilia sp. 9I]|nr:hypothetical protein MASSI9I_100175 [Massilia sp. 9I]